MANTRKTVLVIGGGLAGITAALTAAKEGAQVSLVSSGPGTFALSGGTVSIQGMNSDQPYLEESIDFFKAMTAAAGCEYKGSFKESVLIPTLLGDFQEVALAPSSLWAGRPVNGSKVMVVGISGLSGFNSHLTAELLTASIKKLGMQIKYSAVDIKIPWLENRTFSSLDLSNFLEKEQYQKQLAELLRPLVGDNNLLLIPAIFKKQMENGEFGRFEKMVGCPICELVTIPPSVVGLRVFQSLEKYLKQIGVEVNIGHPGQMLQLADGYCTSVIMDNPGRKRVIKAQNVIVATGRINENSLAINITGKDHENFLQKNIRFNENMQLLSETDIPIAANVYGAGSILNNYDRKNGNALAIVTAYRAGIMAAGVTR